MNGLQIEKDSTRDKFIRVSDMYPRDPKSLIYVLSGIPIPLQRHQHGNGHTWDPQKQKKVITAISIASIHGTRPKYSGPLHLDIRFYFPKPQSGPRSKTTWQFKPHDIKPDISNCIKYVEDVCSKLLFEDDCLIASLFSEKIYDLIPRTEFFIQELSNYNGTKTI